MYNLYNAEESQQFASMVSDIFYSDHNSQEYLSQNLIEYKRNWISNIFIVKRFVRYLRYKQAYVDYCSNKIESALRVNRDAFFVKSRKLDDLNSVVKVIFQQNLDDYNQTDQLFILPLVFNILNDLGNTF